LPQLTLLNRIAPKHILLPPIYQGYMEGITCLESLISIWLSVCPGTPMTVFD
jgi:hypothetical protein